MSHDPNDKKPLTLDDLVARGASLRSGPEWRPSTQLVDALTEIDRIEELPAPDPVVLLPEKGGQILVAGDEAAEAYVGPTVVKAALSPRMPTGPVKIRADVDPRRQVTLRSVPGAGGRAASGGREEERKSGAEETATSGALDTATTTATATATATAATTAAASGALDTATTTATAAAAMAAAAMTAAATSGAGRDDDDEERGAERGGERDAEQRGGERDDAAELAATSERRPAAEREGQPERGVASGASGATRDLATFQRPRTLAASAAVEEAAPVPSVAVPSATASSRRPPRGDGAAGSSNEGRWRPLLLVPVILVALGVAVIAGVAMRTPHEATSSGAAATSLRATAEPAGAGAGAVTSAPSTAPSCAAACPSASASAGASAGSGAPAVSTASTSTGTTSSTAKPAPKATEDLYVDAAAPGVSAKASAAPAASAAPGVAPVVVTATPSAAPVVTATPSVKPAATATPKPTASPISTSGPILDREDNQ